MTDSEIVSEHEVLVHVDFDTRIEDECLEDLKQFKFIGIETDEPVLQLGDQVFKGGWKDIVGTHVFLEEIEDRPEGLDVFLENSQTQVQYVCKTDKLLKMQRVFISLKEKDSENAESKAKEESENAETDDEMSTSQQPESQDDTQ